MPSKSKPQHDFMAAIAHDPRFARKAGVPVSVGQEFFNADKKAKKFASGGAVQGPLTQSRNLLTQTNVLPSDTPDIGQLLRDKVNSLNSDAGAHIALLAQAAKDHSLSSPSNQELLNRLSDNYAPGGIMIGPASTLWNQANAFQASKMLAKGAPSADVWAATQTFRPPSGGLRQEIDDSAARFLPQYDIAAKAAAERDRIASLKEQIKPVTNGQKDLFPGALTDARRGVKADITNSTNQLERHYGGEMNAYSGNFAPIALEHPSLYDAYPELNQVVVRQGHDLGGAFGSASPDRITLSPKGLADDPRGTMLHEMQHQVQNVEGWPGGSSPEYEGQLMYEKHVNDLEDSGVSRPDAMRSANAQQFSGIDNYLASPGEVEARAVDRRANLTPAERLSRDPNLDYIPDQNFAKGGPVQGPLTQSRNLLTQTNVLPSDVDNSNLRESLPRVYGALAGLMGTAPDQLEGSVMEPGYDARKQGAAMTFPIGTALQMLPGLKGLATAMAAEKMVPSGSLAAQRGAITWHGSPHNFDAFDASKIGTGEGAQAYGHGLYLAENPVVAKGYKTSGNAAYPEHFIGGEKLHPDQMVGPKGDWGLDAGDFQDITGTPFGEITGQTAKDALLKSGMSPDTQDWMSQIPADQFKITRSPGNIYSVDLPDTHITKMLDWDKALSDQHPDVQAALAKTDFYPYAADQLENRAVGRNPGGDDLHKWLSEEYSPDEVAGMLQQAGIPGIKYLDGGSRGAGTGTSNYVVFPGEEKNLTILDRNGVPTGNAPPPATPITTGPETSQMIADTPPQAFAKGGLVPLDHMIRHHILQHADPMTLTPDDHAFMGQMADSGVGS
jgi:hypothetical protein